MTNLIKADCGFDPNAQKQLEVKLPANTTLYNGTITKANGMTLVYRFFTDGISIYCHRGVYA